MELKHCSLSGDEDTLLDDLEPWLLDGLCFRIAEWNTLIFLKIASALYCSSKLDQLDNSSFSFISAQAVGIGSVTIKNLSCFCLISCSAVDPRKTIWTFTLSWAPMTATLGLTQYLVGALVLTLNIILLSPSFSSFIYSVDCSLRGAEAKNISNLLHWAKNYGKKFCNTISSQTYFWISGVQALFSLFANLNYYSYGRLSCHCSKLPLFILITVDASF